ncbi:MAG TPA: glycosyltransferase family 4 protein [Verrucomicrobiae bacterium]|nr:glycosyltransferase family 4 protein [Verrucomicrobiae bacterium]
MLTVAYLANQFPSPVEPYVADEIEELERRGVRVIAGSMRRAADAGAAEIVLLPLSPRVLPRAVWLCFREWMLISPLIARVLFRGRESPLQRAKALLHTLLGACYAVRLEKMGVDHIHAHHGYFGSWVAMVAARFLGTGFSMTLHGSDLLLRASYLDVKLANCAFCLTVSEYNRRYIAEHYPDVQQQKVFVSRLGVETAEPEAIPRDRNIAKFAMLAVGRLHRVKDHAFLIRACAQLRASGLNFECPIAGEGPERRRLEFLIRRYSLENQVILLGHVPREQMDSLYRRSDLVVLTSRSEGIPLVLMEAMLRGKVVLAPAITGIPELIVPGRTGFLYECGSQADFVARVLYLHSLLCKETDRLKDSSVLWASRTIDWVRHAAQVQVRHGFDRKKNLESFADLFINAVRPARSNLDEDPLLQQVQLSFQRHRSVPVRIDGVDAGAGARSSAVLDG